MSYVGPREKSSRAKKQKQRQHFYNKNEKWDSVCKYFVESISNADTQRLYKGTLLLLISFVEQKYGAVRTPDKISREDIEEFLRQPISKGRRAGLPPSAYTVNAYLNAIRAFYLHCTRTIIEFRGKKVPLLRKGMLPTDSIELAKTGEVDRDMTESEVRAFFAAIDRTTLHGKRDYALFWALLITGRRRREITSLRRGDLETFEFAEGRRGWRFHFRGKWRVTKESAEMPQSVVDALVAFHADAGSDFMTMPPETPLFPGTKKGLRLSDQPISLNYVAPLFKKYARKAGIADNSVAHSLRWENAWQRYLANGKDVFLVQEDLGWKSANQALHYIKRRRKKQAGDPTAGAIAAKFQ